MVLTPASEVPLYEPDLSAPELMNTSKHNRRIRSVLWGVRPDRGGGWLTVSGSVTDDHEKAATWTTFDRAERHIRLMLLGGLKDWRPSMIPHTLPGGDTPIINTALLNGDEPDHAA